MLEDALSPENADKKKRLLQEKHGIEMTVELEGKVNDMCNLSDLVEERGIRKGMEKGIEKGRKEGREEGEKQGAVMIARNLFANGTNFELVKSCIEYLSEEELKEIYQEVVGE